MPRKERPAPLPDSIFSGSKAPGASQEIPVHNTFIQFDAQPHSGDLHGASRQLATAPACFGVSMHSAMQSALEPSNVPLQKQEDDAAEDENDDDAEADAVISAAMAAGELPSLGSSQHAEARCKRCCFYPKGRCLNGYNCEFCHFEHEKRKRKKKKKKGAKQEEEDESDSDEEEQQQQQQQQQQRQQQQAGAGAPPLGSPVGKPVPVTDPWSQDAGTAAAVGGLTAPPAVDAASAIHMQAAKDKALRPGLPLRAPPSTIGSHLHLPSTPPPTAGGLGGKGFPSGAQQLQPPPAQPPPPRDGWELAAPVLPQAMPYLDHASYYGAGAGYDASNPWLQHMDPAAAAAGYDMTAFGAHGMPGYHPSPYGAAASPYGALPRPAALPQAGSAHAGRGGALPPPR